LEPSPYFPLLKKHGILVVEDACQAHGSTGKKYVPDNGSIAACYSFYPTKNLGCLGDGGAIVTNSRWISDELRKSRGYGVDPQTGKIHNYGKNSRLDTLQAAFLREKLKSLDKVNAFKRAVAERYHEKLLSLTEEFRISIKPPIHGENSHITPLFVHSDDRDHLRAYLRIHKVDTKIHYPIPAHLQPVEDGLHQKLPMTELLCRTEISLPNWFGMSFSKVDYVCKQIEKYYGYKRQ